MKIDPNDVPDWDKFLLMGTVVVPRPIALISTVSKKGLVNVAPYSLFNIVCYWPPIIYFSPHRKPGYLAPHRKPGNLKKDTLRNVEETKEFVVNMVIQDIAEAMCIAGANYPPDVSELEPTKLTAIPSDLVKAPRIAESPINMECRLKEIVQFGEPNITADMVLGEVLRVHIEDKFYHDGNLDLKSLQVVGKMGHQTYTRNTDLFDMQIPTLGNKAQTS